MAELPQEMVDSAAGLTACCEHLASRPALGFDTEFIGETSYHPLLCLVQVATDERLYLIDPLAGFDMAPFWELVADPDRVCIVHAGREEVRMCRHGIGRPPGRLFDVQIAAGLVGLGYPLGHAALVQQLLRAHLSKAETLTDWSRRPLSASQVKYAYNDVRYLLLLHKKLHGKLERRGRVAWAEEEFAASVRRALVDNPESERWRKLRGAGSLDRRKLAVLRELYLWREAFAERVNRPARSLVRDDVVVELARRSPQTDRDLTALRGMPRHDPAPILEAVARGQAVPAEELPAEAERDNDPASVALVANLLQAVLGDYCGREGLTPSLVATSADVKGLVRARYRGQPVPADSPLTRGWRGEHVLPVLQSVLDGRVGLRVVDVTADAPFARMPLDEGGAP